MQKTGDTTDEHPNVFRFLIPSADGCRLLVLRVGKNYKLPEVCPPKTGEFPWIESWNRHTDDLCAAVKRTLSLSGYARNLVWFNPDTPPEYNDVAIIFDVEDFSSIPSGYITGQQATALPPWIFYQCALHLICRV